MLPKSENIYFDLMGRIFQGLENDICNIKLKPHELVNNLNRYKRLSQQSLQAFSFHIPFDFISSLYVAKKQLGAVLTSPPSAHQYKLATEAEKEKRISANMSYEKELIDQNKLDAVSEVVEVFRY